MKVLGLGAQELIILAVLAVVLVAVSLVLRVVIRTLATPDRRPRDRRRPFPPDPR